MKVYLLTIDPQVDFCTPTGALFVNGAVEDMQRLASFVRRTKDKLDDIFITLDSHHPVHIAHSIFWRNPNDGSHPAPFTMITHKDVADGKWVAAQPSFHKWCLEYTAALEKGGKYPLVIWPRHCTIGSAGHAVVPELYSALTEWEEQFAVVNYVTKGSNIKTEHYSALKAEVPDPKDSNTSINTNLVDALLKADMIAIAGEASSHCLANTVRDIAEAFGDDKYIQKLVLLQDATSPVGGFEKLQDDFIKEMTYRGMQISTTDKFLK